MWRNLPDFWAEKKVWNPVMSLAVMAFGSRPSNLVDISDIFNDLSCLEAGQREEKSEAGA